MKLALLLFSVLSLSLWFGTQGTAPVECRGKSLPITFYEVGLKLTGPSIPLRFGGTRAFPSFGFKTDKALRLVIKNQDQYNEFWKQLTAPIAPGNWIPPRPEIDFSKEMLIVSANGQRPSSGFWTIIDGACEGDGRVEIFITNVEDTGCGGNLGVLTYPADAVRIPRSDLPVVFREREISCKDWYEKYLRYN
ncbi:MAG: hypothetical protein LC794_17960 [Acidobacteria bacterium]|nr:hypothetical protein [Acidobacteriota bacterium]